MPPVVMMNIGTKLTITGKKLLEKQGITSFTQRIIDISIGLTGIVQNIDLKEIYKTISYDLKKNEVVLGMSTITPAAYHEGIIRGNFTIYKKLIQKIEHKREGDFDIFTIKWS